MARELDITINVQNAEAVQKLRETDVAIDQVGSTAIRTSTAIDSSTAGWDTYTVSAKEAAEVLSGTGGIRAGLNAVAESAGITFTQLGLVTSAGLAIGVGYEAWNIGRAIADFFELDEKIAHNTATLMNWGDVAAEAAGAKADALARASKIAGREITDMGEALRINGQQVKEWSDTMARANGPEEARLQIARWHNEIALIENAGLLRAFTENIKSNDFSIKFLADTYRISAGAITFYKNELKAADDEQKASDAYLKDRAKAMADALAAEEKAHRALLDAKREVLLITTHINKEYDAEISKHDQIIQKLQTEASLSEFKAKEKIMGGFGLSANGTPLELLNDPLVKVTKALEDLQAKTQAGISQEAQKQVIYDEFIQETQKATQSTDALKTAQNKAGAAGSAVAGAHAGAASASDVLSRAHTGAVHAADGLSDAFASFRGVLVGTVDGLSGLAASARNAAASVDPSTGMYTGDNLGMPTGSGVGIAGTGFITNTGRKLAGVRADGGPVGAGQTYLVGERGPELFTPGQSGAITPNGGGGTVVHVTITGNNIDSDSRARRLADDVADRVARKLQQNQRMTFSKS